MTPMSEAYLRVAPTRAELAAGAGLEPAAGSFFPDPDCISPFTPLIGFAGNVAMEKVNVWE